VKSIDVLPDDILLEVFEFLVDENPVPTLGAKWWQSLVHVCRRWRSVIFRSPRRLKLRLRCTARTPVRDMLDIWPPFPLVVDDIDGPTEDMDNVVAALERRDRVDRIRLRWVHGSSLEKVLAEMQEPFPELTFLQLSSSRESVPIVLDSFLGRSAPRLGVLVLDGIPFPGLPELLLSATYLVYLHLYNIPHSGYISPDAMVTALTALTCLQFLDIGFRSPRSHPDQASRLPPPPSRTVFPALTIIWFKGVCEYLDDLVARIDAPQLNNLHIMLFNDVVFDAPQFIQFISRTPTLKAVENAHVVFGHRKAIINCSSQTSPYQVQVTVGVSCRELDWQVSSLEQLYASHFPPLSTLEDLYIYEPLDGEQPDWRDNIENTLWLDLLHRFSTVKNLYLSKEFAPRIVAALQELGVLRTTEVLPTLQNIFLEEVEPAGRAQEDIGRIVTARRLFGHTITVSHWERDPTQERDLPFW
jgi:F-box-like